MRRETPETSERCVRRHGIHLHLISDSNKKPGAILRYVNHFSDTLRPDALRTISGCAHSSSSLPDKSFSLPRDV